MASSETQALNLFQEIEHHFPSASLGQDKWEILTLASLVAGSRPDLAGTLYTHLISRPQYQTSPQRQALVRRLRETLVKSVPIIGVLKVIEATFSIGAQEREEDRDYSFSRENWKSGEENQSRGMDWFNSIYRSDDAAPGGTKEKMMAHKDIRWLSIEITYGLYLSDHSIVDGVDTEIIVLSGIMMQNCSLQVGWHLRGMRRVGVKHEDVEIVQQCIEKVAKFCGLTLDKIPRVKDIEHEV